MSKKYLSWVLALMLTLVFAGCTEVPEAETPVYETDLTEEEAERNSAFEEYFPLQYQTYQRLKAEDFDYGEGVMTEYAGSVAHPKHMCDDLPEGYKYCQPYLKNLWLGYPFSYEYNRARGHANAVHDILDIDRLNRYSEEAGLPATCWNCKTNKMPGYIEEYGDDFWAMEFHDFREEHDLEDHAVGCNTCHDPEDMSLRITSVPLTEALERQGEDWRDASRNEMRSLVCAQCHVEYYFEHEEIGVAAKPKFPWDQGKNPEDIYEYKKGFGITDREGFEGWFIDWTHPVSDTPMIKTQHPEYEMWHDSTHGAAGVACADCHMPYTRMDGKKKISSHFQTSPLRSLEAIDKTCGQCHTDKDPQYLKDLVIYSQERTWEQLMEAQRESVRAHEAVRLASEYEGEVRDNFDELMIKARERVRKGQWFWDYVSAENSAGFHNPAKAIDTLAKSQKYSRQAVEYAEQAVNYGISPELEGDIKDIVPPIEEHSRELHMDPEHLETHEWFQYLDPHPEGELIWDLNEKVAN